MTTDWSYEEVEKIEMQILNKDEHPQYFSAESFATFQTTQNADGSTNIYTIKDPEKYSLKNSVGSSTLDAEFFSFVIKMCDNSTSTVVCASFGENYEHLIEYLTRFSLFIFTTTNYIDYDEVDPFKGPIKQISELAYIVKLATLEHEYSQFRRSSFTET